MNDTSQKTLVLDISELQEIIPEINNFESTQFKSLKELLFNVISTIEQDGNWTFVQYISSKPSLFIIKPRNKMDNPELLYADKISELLNKTETESKLIHNLLEQQDKSAEEYKIPSVLKEDNLLENTKTASLFDNKLSWEK